jgi:hypothetical protein
MEKPRQSCMGCVCAFAKAYAELGTMAGFGFGSDISHNRLRYTGSMQDIAHSRHEDCQVLPGYRAIPKPKPAITKTRGGQCRKA